MKIIFAAFLAIFAFSTMATTVKVTSFNYIRVNNDLNHPLAELCGKVEGATFFPTFIKVLIDPKSKDPASYNTFAGEDGKFCLSVITYRGNAELSVIGGNSTIEALVR